MFSACFAGGALTMGARSVAGTMVARASTTPYPSLVMGRASELRPAMGIDSTTDEVVFEQLGRDVMFVTV